MEEEIEEVAGDAGAPVPTIGAEGLLAPTTGEEEEGAQSPLRQERLQEQELLAQEEGIFPLQILSWAEQQNHHQQSQHGSVSMPARPN